MIVVLDTSALGKLLIEEPESESLRAFLAEQPAPSRTFVISSLAVTELRRMALRLRIDQSLTEQVLRPFHTVRVSEAVLQIAGRLPQLNLRTLDAIHIATALAIEAQLFITFGARQFAAATAEGLVVESPGAR